MLKQILPITGSSIFLLLGAAHLYFTFFTNKFNAKNDAVTEGMKNTSPVLTRKLNMWKAWIGFNASHGLGAIFFGGFNVLLFTQAYKNGGVPCTFQILNITVCLCYLFIGLKYWFKTPILGIALATLCFIAGWLM